MKQEKNRCLNLTRLAAGAVMLVALAGCGDDDENGSAGDPFRAGTWNLTVTSSSSGPGECPSGPETVTFQLPLCSGDDPAETVGEDCEGDYDGNTVTFDCVETTQDGGCSVTTRTVGTGTFGETSFNISAQITETAAQGEGCVVSPCTTTVQLMGTWLASSGSCKSGTVDLRSILHRSIEKAVPGLRIRPE